MATGTSWREPVLARVLLATLRTFATAVRPLPDLSSRHGHAGRMGGLSAAMWAYAHANPGAR